MSIFPFITSDIDRSEASESLPLLKEYAYDYENNELLVDERGCTYLVEGNEALRIWIFKALTTARFRYMAYTYAFGEEYEDQLVGHVVNGEILKSEMERFITEALMVNPYIERIDNFVFISTSGGLNVSFDCTSVYGKETIPFLVKEVKG